MAEETPRQLFLYILVTLSPHETRTDTRHQAQDTRRMSSATLARARDMSPSEAETTCHARLEDQPAVHVDGRPTKWECDDHEATKRRGVLVRDVRTSPAHARVTATRGGDAMTSRQAQVASLSAHLQVRPRNARAFSSCSATRGVMDRNALRLLTAANKRAAPCENRKREFSRIFNLVTHTDTAPAFSLATGQTHPPRVAQPEPDVPAPPLAFGEPARVRQQNTRLALRRPGPRVPSRRRRLASAQQPGRPRPPPDPQRESAKSAFANLVASRARRVRRHQTLFLRRRELGEKRVRRRLLRR